MFSIHSTFVTIIPMWNLYRHFHLRIVSRNEIRVRTRWKERKTTTTSRCHSSSRMRWMKLNWFKPLLGGNRRVFSSWFILSHSCDDDRDTVWLNISLSLNTYIHIAYMLVGKLNYCFVFCVCVSLCLSFCRLFLILLVEMIYLLLCTVQKNIMGNKN